MDISSVGNGAKGNEKYNVGPMDFRQSTGMADAWNSKFSTLQTYN